MNAILTLLLLLTLFVLISLPGLAAIVRPRAAVIAVPFYLLLTGGLVIHYLGLSFGGEMPARAGPAAAPEGLCRQALDQAEGGGLIVDRSNPVRVTVSRALWAQLPQQAKEGLVLCLERARPEQLADTPVEIVEIPPQ